jgi:predicted nucleotidyltransferase
MPREKIEHRHEVRIVEYSEDHWRLLRSLRAEALTILDALARAGLRAIVHGSIARGDVHPGSDIDVFIPYPVPAYAVELALERAGLRPSHKLVVQATPHSTPKAYIVLDVEERRIVSFPLAKLSRTEYEFYYFGGALDAAGLRSGRRVPGVDKRLMLIEPLPRGHRETSVIGREAEAARKVGVSLETVLERVRVLSRRDEHGRTGVFVKIELGSWDSIEEAVRREARRNPAFRRVLVERGSPYL